MDQLEIPILDPLSDIQNNISISLPLSSQFSTDWFNRIFCGSDYDDQNKASSASTNSKAKNIANEGDYNTSNINGGENKAKNIRKKKKAIPQRIAFHTRSEDDVLDDGYGWRKYGQKTVKNNPNPRRYYRCSHHTCSVKKQIQRLSMDSRIVVTTYEGVHNHPCKKLMESLGPLLKQLQFLSRI